MFRCCLLSGLACMAALVSADDATSVTPLASCSSSEEAEFFFHRYHSPNICGRYEEFTASMQHERQVDFHRLREAGIHHRVPDQETVFCPVDPIPLSAPHHVTGLKQVWVVENTASVPVVLAWVDTTTGKEYSAMNSRISPPQADPNTILAPGKDALVYAYEANVFHARELLEDGTTGDILMQHRAGLIPVGAHAEDLQCNVVAVPVLEEEEEELPTGIIERIGTYYERLADASVAASNKGKDLASKVASYSAAAAVVPMAVLGAGLDALLGQYLFKPKKTVLKAVDPEPLTVDKTERVLEFRREPPAPVRKECNGLEIGFRNRSPCPLHASWVNSHQQCAEHFRFHLGVESNKTSESNFMWDWTSQTKFESTFLGHQYVFRLASNPNLVVDTITLQPTRIIDCPRQKKQPQPIGSGAASVRLPKTEQESAGLEMGASENGYSQWNGVSHPKTEL